MRKSKRRRLMKERKQKDAREFMERFIEEDVPRMVMDGLTGISVDRKSITKLAQELMVEQSPRRGLSILLKAYRLWEFRKLLGGV